MSLSSAIFKLTGVKPEIKEASTRKWLPCKKHKSYFESKDGKFSVELDKNGQVCGGTFMATHKGRPVKVEGRKILCPVNVMVESEDGESWVSVFDHYEVLFVAVK